MVWCFVRYFIPTPSGRKRFNVLGAVDALTKEIIMVANETTVTAPNRVSVTEQAGRARHRRFDHGGTRQRAVSEMCAGSELRCGIRGRITLFAIIFAAPQSD